MEKIHFHQEDNLWIMTSIFRQAFLNISWGWQSSFGGWFSRTPSIPSWERFTWHSLMPAHVPMSPRIPTISTPKVETTSLRVWVDYQGNGYGNRAETIARMKEKLDKNPNIKPEDLPEFIANAHFEEVEEQRKNPNGFSFLDVPLPEWTEWKDLRIQITWNGWDKARNWTVDFYLRDKKIKLTNFHEMELEDTVRWGISKSWRVLIFLALKWRFKWETELTPSNLRKAKERFSDDLKKIFGLSSDPIMKIDNAYFPQLTIGINHNLIDVTRKETLEEIFNY